MSSVHTHHSFMRTDTSTSLHICVKKKKLKKIRDSLWTRIYGTVDFNSIIIFLFFVIVDNWVVLGRCFGFIFFVLLIQLFSLAHIFPHSPFFHFTPPFLLLPFSLSFFFFFFVIVRFLGFTGSLFAPFSLMTNLYC
jgi:hypothetical protein